MPVVARSMRDPDVNPCLSVSWWLSFVMSVKLEKQAASDFVAIGFLQFLNKVISVQKIILTSISLFR